MLGSVGLIQVELDRGIAVLDGLGRRRGELLRRGQPRLIERRVAVDADLVAELPAEQLIHRHVQRLAGQIPQRRFHGRQHRHEDARLRAAEDAALPHLLEDPVHVERVLAANPLTEALDEVVGAADGVDPLAAAPDALVGMDLHEQAAAHVAALQIGDAQRGRARRLLRVVDGLPECGQRPRGGGGRQATGGQERTPTVARVLITPRPILLSRYLISKMNTRPPASGAGPACTVPAGTKLAFGVVAGVGRVEDQFDGVA